MHNIARLAQAHDDIVGLDVAMDIVLSVEVLDTLQKLVKNHQGGFQTESLTTVVEQVLQARTKHVGHQINQGIIY